VGPASLFVAWSGGAFDTQRNRLVLWGGGHGDYYGNEVYAFDVGTLRWTRLNDPTVNPTLNQDVNWDGTPGSRHTYNGLAYIAHADRFFGLGGSIQGNGFGACQNTWTFDFNSLTWRNMAPGGTRPTTAFGDNCSYDPGTRKVWWCENSAPGLYSYDVDANTWAKHNSDSYYYYTSCIDTRRGVMVIVGNGNVYAYDLRNANYTRQTWATTGGSSFIAKGNAGLDYDPVADRIVGWRGGSPYLLDPVSKVWTVGSSTGAPSEGQNGVYGRWRYVPSVNAFVLASGFDADVHFYKASAGAGSSPSPPPTSPPSTTPPTTPPSSPSPPSGGAPGPSAAGGDGTCSCGTVVAPPSPALLAMAAGAALGLAATLLRRG
jgi:hypothetical protein